MPSSSVWHCVDTVGFYLRLLLDIFSKLGNSLRVSLLLFSGVFPSDVVTALIWPMWSAEFMQHDWIGVFPSGSEYFRTWLKKPCMTGRALLFPVPKVKAVLPWKADSGEGVSESIHRTNLNQRYWEASPVSDGAGKE